MRFAELVRTAEAVAATPRRRRKVTLLAGLLARLEGREIEIGAGYLAGEPRQGKLGVGWRTLQAIDPTPAEGPSLEIADVHDRLAALASLDGRGSRRMRHEALADLFARADADEGRYLRALLLGELRQGALAGVLAQAIAEAWGLEEGLVRRAAMLGGDLGEVAKSAAEGGDDALRAFRLQLFRPLQAMLAQTAASLEEALHDLRPAIVEWKLDGARVQVHRDGGEVRVFTRALRDVTATHGGVVEVVRALAVDRVVLDGEALALRPDGTPEAFQDSMRRGAALTPFFFDVLHADGADLLDAPLARRRELLEQLVAAPHRVPAAVLSTREQAQEFLVQALARGHEGVMVKDPESRYEAGRRGAAWRKVKPVHTLDLVVLAAEWGSGRRRGLLSNLHLGARDDDGGFVMLGKTFKGLTDDLLAWQTRELLSRETAREGAVVHVRPELVVEVAFDGVQASTRYPGGVTLRFARVRRYRDDKSAAEADTLHDVRALHGATADGAPDAR